MTEDGWTDAPVRCAAGRRTTVRVAFGQCWDGTGRAPSAVVTPVDGACPAGYAHAIPQLIIRAQLEGEAWPPTFSSGGAPTLHADFWNAWDPARLALLVGTCIRGDRSSNVEVRRCRVTGGGPPVA